MATLADPRKVASVTEFPKLLMKRGGAVAKKNGVDNMRDITETILSEVADEEGVDPLELEPLYTSVDPEALQALWEPPSDVNRVEFEYAGYEVIIEDENHVRLESI